MMRSNLPGELFLKRLHYLHESTCVGICFHGNKVAGLKEFFIKTRVQHRCYLVNHPNFSRTLFFTEGL